MTAKDPAQQLAAGDLQRRVDAYMQRRRYVMTLATCAPAAGGPAGGAAAPWSSAVYFAHRWDGEGLRLYFLSSPSARHSRNVAGSGRAAAAIHEDEHDWRAICGVQLAGSCRFLAGGEAEAGRAVYFAKYPFARSLAGEGIEVYGLFVDELYWVETRRGFGREPVPLWPGPQGG